MDGPAKMEAVAMSLARQMDSYGRMADGTAARTLPQPERAPRPEVRPAPKKQKQTRRGYVLGGLVWAVFMALSLVTVWRNSLVLKEASATTKAKEELAALQQENKALQNQLVTAHSVTEVERWAVAHSMVRPTNVAALTADPSAVAHREPPAAEQAPAAAEAAPGFWDQVKAAFTPPASAAPAR